VGKKEKIKSDKEKGINKDQRSVSSKEIKQSATVKEKMLVVQEQNGTSLRQSPLVSCYKWL
jgi:hypothetical protein